MPRLIELSSDSESEEEDTILVKHEDTNKASPRPRTLVSGNPRPTPSFKNEPDHSPISSHGTSASASYIPALLREEIDSVKREIHSLNTCLANAQARLCALYERGLRQNFESEVKAEPDTGPTQMRGLGRKSRHMSTHGSTERNSVAAERRSVINVGSSATSAATERDSVAAGGRSVVAAERQSVVSVDSSAVAAATATTTAESVIPVTEDVNGSVDGMDIDSDTPLFPDLQAHAGDDDDDHCVGVGVDVNVDIELSDGPGLAPARSIPVTAARRPVATSVSSTASRNPTTVEEAIQNLRPALERFACAPDVHRTWTRKHISSVMGGGPQETWPSPQKNKSFPFRLSSEYYICLKRELNHWLPRNPGDRGGLTVFRNKATHDHVYPLFVHFQHNKWKYMGNYKAVNLPINGGYLSLAQWRRNFTGKQKLDWASHIISKAWGRQILLHRRVITQSQYDMGNHLKNSFRPEDLVKFFEREDDDRLRLRLQVRLLEPHSFDRRLYDTLATYGHEDEAENADGENDEDLAPPQRRRRNAVLDSDDDKPFQPDNDSYEEHGSNSDAPTRHRQQANAQRAHTQMRTRTSRTLVQRQPTCWVDLDSGDENTLHRYKPAVVVASAAPPAGSPPSRRIKRERTESDNDDLYSRPAVRARTTRSQSVELVAPLTPWQAPTSWNKAVASSANPDRKAYAHELITVWPPFSFPNHEPPLLPLGFTHAFLSKFIGGGFQNVKCKVSVEKALNNNHRINIYHCEDPKWNPHLPKKPGAHGVVYYPAPEENNPQDPKTTTIAWFLCFASVQQTTGSIWENTYKRDGHLYLVNGSKSLPRPSSAGVKGFQG
ncbi:hypothetical protein BDD12DRAFT_882771 [Trichophaea hybrida]|nr:hypothetical protein BDD12DRAFT_882771 [Trichophaea hybrida]